ncbi:MAG: carboxypeptidase-like regulatory domain-containing protein, partial [Candidatus Acidiferrales bacterium]
MAQTTVGTISGTVTDPTGAVVPGATVTLVHEATGVTREATSNEQGGFVFDRARVGTYTLRITMSGFKVHEQRNLEVSAGKVSALGEVKLEVGSTGETITIEGSVTPLVQGDSPQIIGAYDARKVQDINWGTFGLDAT